MSLIACIIPAYNAEPYLERAVRSLLDCGVSGLEIVIVDDGSSDRTFEVAQLISSREKSVTACRHPAGQNRGVSATRNFGIERSHGELICFLDGDDYVYPHRFASALEILSQRPEVDGVYGLTELVFADDAARAGWWNDDTLFGFREPILPTDLLENLLKGRCWATSAIVVRRKLLERTGLFDPRLHIAEDCNLWFRLAFSGTLVAGDLSRPISAYWRTTGSAYQPAVSQRMQMLLAIQYFLDWLKSQPGSDAAQVRVRRQMCEYVINGIISARTSKRRDVAWWLAGRSVQLYPRVVLHRGFQRQLLSMALGR